MSRGKNVVRGKGESVGVEVSHDKETKAFYACDNHKHKRSVAQGTCPMLPVFEQDVKNAFATTLNRLAAEPSILGVSDDGEAEREHLDAQLQSVRRRQSVLHDRALADRYTAQLRKKKAALDSEEKTILDALAKLEKKNPVDDLKRAVVKRGVRESFTESDEKLFTSFVDHAVLWSKKKRSFISPAGWWQRRTCASGRLAGHTPRFRLEWNLTSRKEHSHGGKSYQSKKYRPRGDHARTGHESGGLLPRQYGFG